MAYHPFLGERDGVMPIMPYHLKERLLESPVLKANGWTMENVLQAEAMSLSEELKKYELLGTEEARWSLERDFAVIEDNVMSGNPTAAYLFGPIYKQLKDIPGIRNQENWWNEPAIVLDDETLEPIEVPDDEEEDDECGEEEASSGSLFSTMLGYGVAFFFIGLVIVSVQESSGGFGRTPLLPIGHIDLFYQILFGIIFGCVGAFLGYRHWKKNH